MSGSPVRVEAKMFGDRRFKRLGRVTPYSWRDAAFRMIEVWSIATDNERECIDVFDLADVFEMDEGDIREAIINSDLGHECECVRKGCVRVKGGGRLGPNGWKTKRANTAKRNGSKSKGRPKKPKPSGLSKKTQLVTSPETQLVSEKKPTGEEEQEQEHEHEKEDLQGTPGANIVAAPRPKRDPNVMKLWQLQAALRSELIADGIAGNGIAITPSLDALADLRECLAEHGYEICEHVLRVYAAEARKTRSLRWLNGVYNWVPRSVRSRVGQTLDDATTQAKAPPKVRMQRVARNGVIVEEPIPECYLNRTGSLGDGPV